MVRTSGNPDCHLILRGGRVPNYDSSSVAAACAELEQSDCMPSLMIDCSHANSSKQPARQVDVAADIAAQIAAGSRHVMGVMVESHLVAGRQVFTPGSDDPAKLAYGQSITDGCLGWDDSVTVLESLDRAVLQRRERASAAGLHRRG